MRALKRGLALALSLTLLFSGCSLSDFSWLDSLLKPQQDNPLSSKTPAASSEAAPVNPNFPVTVGDVTIAQQPKRVVALNPSIVEILYDMGMQSLLVGVGEQCNYPEAAKSLTPCRTEVAPDTGAIIAREADLVLSLNPLPSAAVSTLSQAGIPCLALTKPQSVEALPEYYTALCIALLGTISGGDFATVYNEQLQNAYRVIGETVAAQTPISGAFVAMLPTTLATGDSLQGQLLTHCGIENAAGSFTDWQYPADSLTELNPQVLVLDSRTVTLEEVAAHENYATVPAVKDQRVLVLDGSAIENMGLRMFASILEMARLAHPDAALPASLEALYTN